MKEKEVWRSIKEVFNLQGAMTESFLKIIVNGNYSQHCISAKAIMNNKYHKKRLESFFSAKEVNSLLSEALIPSPLTELEFSEHNFFKDIQFMLAFMSAYKEKVLLFLEQKCIFEHEYLTGNYKNAEEALYNIYKITGLSFWYIEMKLLLLNETNYSEYCNYYLSIRNGCKDEQLKNYIRLLKRKVHMRTNHKDFIKFFERHISEYDSLDIEENVWRTYFEFSSVEQTNLPNITQKYLLCVALHHLTFVDVFLLLEKLILLLYATDSSEKIRTLYMSFKNTFIINDEERGKQYNNIKRLFCENQFEECIVRCEEQLKYNAHYFEIVDIYVKSLMVAGRRPEDNRPLDLIVRILISCYIKQDNTHYASSYIDQSDCYLRAWNKFSGFYELFNVLLNTMYSYKKEYKTFFDMKLLKRPYCSSEGALLHKILENDLENTKKTLGTLYTCEWGQDFFELYDEKYGIQADFILRKINMIRENKSIPIDIHTNMSNVERLLYQEKASRDFAEYVKDKKYMDAIHLYMKTYFLGIFLVTKMDILALNSEMEESAYIPMLADIDFFIYASITNLNQNFPDEPSQCVIDSFAEILTKNKIGKPSELIYEGIEDNAQYLKFFDLCCNKILEESPCDLYDEDLYEEQLKLLDCLYYSCEKHNYQEKLQDYQEKKKEVRQKYNNFVLRSKSNYHEKAVEKIYVDWITLEYDNNIASAYDLLKGYTIDQICSVESLFTEFKRVLIHCKKEYVRKINKQMGTTIRHGVLDEEIAQIMKKHNLFIPECDDEEKIEMIDSNERILSYRPSKRSSIWFIMQKNCLKLFNEIEEIKSCIFFIDKEESSSEKYISVYMDNDEIKECLMRCKSFEGEARFIRELKQVLDYVIETRVFRMRKVIEDRLTDLIRSYIKNLKQDFFKENLFVTQTEQIEEDFEKTIHSIGEWFQVIHDSNQFVDLPEYLDTQNSRYPNITFIYEKVPCSLNLGVIHTIDIILINLIRNIETHSGFFNPKKAQAKIVIQVDEDNKMIEIRSSNRIENSIDKAYVENKIRDINRILRSSTNGDLALDEREKVKTGRDNSHGLGLIRIGVMLQQNYQVPCIFSSFENGAFCISISFIYGGGNGEYTTY